MELNANYLRRGELRGAGEEGFSEEQDPKVGSEQEAENEAKWEVVIMA